MSLGGEGSLQKHGGYESSSVSHSEVLKAPNSWIFCRFQETFDQETKQEAVFERIAKPVAER